VAALVLQGHAILSGVPDSELKLARKRLKEVQHG
jgi:hypothetical protein